MLKSSRLSVMRLASFLWAAARIALSVVRLVLTSAGSFRCSSVDPRRSSAARSAGSNAAVSATTSAAQP